MRNALACVGKGHAEMVAAAIRTIFAQPDEDLVRADVETVAATLSEDFPLVARMLRDARADMTAPTALHTTEQAALTSANDTPNG